MNKSLIGGDWNHGILNDFPYIGNVIITTDDVNIFQRGRVQTTNQLNNMATKYRYIVKWWAKHSTCNIWGILMGSMLPYIAAPWILWVWEWFLSHLSKWWLTGDGLWHCFITTYWMNYQHPEVTKKHFRHWYNNAHSFLLIKDNLWW